MIFRFFYWCLSVLLVFSTNVYAGSSASVTITASVPSTCEFTINNDFNRINRANYKKIAINQNCNDYEGYSAELIDENHNDIALSQGDLLTSSQISDQSQNLRLIISAN